MVLFLERPQWCTIVDLHCVACPFEKHVDGSEVCMLRKKEFKSKSLSEEPFELCFSWSLLYYMCDQIDIGVTYYAILRQMIRCYARGGKSTAWLCAMQSIYRHLRDAFMDFVDLMRLPMNDQWCRCERHDYVADGIMLAPKRMNMHLSGAFIARPSDDPVPAHYGSLFSDRFVLPRSVRALVHRLSTKGVSLAELVELQRMCHEGNIPALTVFFGVAGPRGQHAHQHVAGRGAVEVGAAAVPLHGEAVLGAAAAVEGNVDDGDMSDGSNLSEDILDDIVPDMMRFEWLAEQAFVPEATVENGFTIPMPDDKHTVPPWSVDFFREVSCDSPALVMAPVKYWALLEHWRECVMSATGHQADHVVWSQEDVNQIRALPQLQGCLQKVLTTALGHQAPKLCKAFADLVGEVVKVCVYIACAVRSVF